MLYEIDDASFVNVWGRMRFVAANDRFLPVVNELAARTGVFQHLVAKAFKDRLEFAPLEVRRWGRRAKPLEGLLVLGH
jgi:hypothetical protein